MTIILTVVTQQLYPNPSNLVSGFTVKNLLHQVVLHMVTNKVPADTALIVNSTGDAANGADANNRCDTGNVIGTKPECTLRAALQAANATSGTATLPITFAIGGDAVPSIALNTPLPDLGHSVSLDATTQPGGKVRFTPPAADRPMPSK
jgi:CSLREA domain-containing protein